MKLKLTMFHKGAIVLITIGMAVTIAGLVMFFKYLNIKEISSLTADDVKNGTYVKGTIQRIISVNEEGSEDLIPAAIYNGDSPTGKDKAFYTVVLTDMAPRSGKYIPIGIDQYEFPEDHQYVFGLALNFDGGDPSIVPDGKFEGIICKNDEYTNSAREFADNALDQYKFVVIDGSVLTEFSGDDISDYYIEIKDMTPRKYIWLIGLPPLLGGIVLAVMAGSPFKKVKKTDPDKK